MYAAGHWCYSVQAKQDSRYQGGGRQVKAQSRTCIDRAEVLHPWLGIRVGQGRSESA